MTNSLGGVQLSCCQIVFLLPRSDGDPTVGLGAGRRSSWPAPFNFGDDSPPRLSEVVGHVASRTYCLCSNRPHRRFHAVHGSLASRRGCFTSQNRGRLSEGRRHVGFQDEHVLLV